MNVSEEGGGVVETHSDRSHHMDVAGVGEHGYGSKVKERGWNHTRTASGTDLLEVAEADNLDMPDPCRHMDPAGKDISGLAQASAGYKPAAEEGPLHIHKV